MAGWFAVIFRFVHVLAAIVWIGNSLLFTWMELKLMLDATRSSISGGAAGALSAHGIVVWWQVSNAC